MLASAASKSDFQWRLVLSELILSELVLSELILSELSLWELSLWELILSELSLWERLQPRCLFLIEAKSVATAGGRFSGHLKAAHRADKKRGH